MSASLDKSRLEKDVSFAELRARFEQGAPFPHLVMRHVFDEPFLQRIARGFDDCAEDGWSVHHTGLLKKRTLRDLTHVNADVRAYFEIMSSPAMIHELEQVTGISGLEPDPALHGGGLHEVRGKGHFEVHVDFRQHPVSGKRNRIVVITYLNQNWKSEDGGALELWQMAPPRAVTRIEPHLGTTFIMSQSALAAHGYPKPTAPGSLRRALVTYYYTDDADSADSLVGERASTDTVYLRYPHQFLGRKALILARRMMPVRCVRLGRRLYSGLAAGRAGREKRVAEKPSGQTKLGGLSETGPMP